jgi:hypothetical protein
MAEPLNTNSFDAPLFAESEHRDADAEAKKAFDLADFLNIREDENGTPLIEIVRELEAIEPRHEQGKA